MTVRNISDFIGALFVVAVVLLLVRPGSAGPQFVKAFTSALAAIIRTATKGTAEETKE